MIQLQTGTMATKTTHRPVSQQEKETRESERHLNIADRRSFGVVVSQIVRRILLVGDLAIKLVD